MFEDVLSGRWYTEHTEMTQESRSDRVATPTGWGTGSTDSHVLERQNKKLVRWMWRNMEIGIR